MYEWTSEAPTSGREPEDGARASLVGLRTDALEGTHCWEPDEGDAGKKEDNAAHDGHGQRRSPDAGEDAGEEAAGGEQALVEHVDAHHAAAQFIRRGDLE